MVGEQVRTNLGRRFDATKDLVRSQIDITKVLVKDVINRVNPMSSKIAPDLPNMARWPGTNPGLIEVVPSYVLLTGDNISKFLQAQSQVNRSWVGK